MLNGDRGEVDYTVSTGDLMTDTHSAPHPTHSADDRHHKEQTDEDAKSERCVTKSLQTLCNSWKSHPLSSRTVRGRAGGREGGFIPMTPHGSSFTLRLDLYLQWRLGAEDVKTDPRSEQRRSRL